MRLTKRSASFFRNIKPAAHRLSCSFYQSLLFFKLFLIINPKCFHRLDDRAHTLAEVAQGVLYSRRYFGINGAGDDTVILHRTQAVGQNLLADAVKAFSQFVEPPRSDEKISQDQQLSLASNQAHCCCDGAISISSYCACSTARTDLHEKMTRKLCK